MATLAKVRAKAVKIVGENGHDYSVSTERVINVASVPHRSLFRYPGGKTWLVPHARRWLRSLTARPHEFAEPFAGGGIVGLSALFEGLADRLVLVELDEDIAAVWQAVTNGLGARLGQRILSFEVNEKNVKAVLAKKPTSTLDRAFATIVRNRMQRGGIMAPGASLMKGGENGRGLMSRWYADTLRKRIDAIVAVRDRISFIQGDGIEFVRYNAHRPEAVFFIDPPYTVAGRRLYAHSELDHEELFRVTASVKGDFLMTYDDTEEIRRLARKFKFDVQRVAMKNTHHEVMRELLIGRQLDWARKPATKAIAHGSSAQSSLELGAAQQ